MVVRRTSFLTFLTDNTITVGDNGQCATVTEALALASSGDTVLVSGDTYAENVTLPDGVTIYLMGSTLGTAGDHSVTIASPAGGESGRVIGWGTLEATDGSIDAAAGAYVELSPDVEVAGAVTGVIRRGRTWTLQSGEAMATYIPADGSVITDVEEGDLLLDLNTPPTLLILRDVGGTDTWV